ncbi:MAG TPA: hypothetical protein PLF50_02600 [Candidatus Cloacimonadota bacterium]|nr:hypothetical protein [Candidatus Cloacimonadota bacterium]
MKKITIVLLLLIFVMGLLFSEVSYSTIDPLSLPTYTGPLNNPNVKIVFEDANGEYILVIFDGKLYAFYM